MPQDIPAWPFLLAGLAFLSFGGFQFAGGSPALGVVLLLLGVGFFGFGLRQGRRAVAGPGEAGSTAAPASAPVPLADRERSIDTYGDPAALRGIEKPKRLCAQCGSPVLEGAAECPTCGRTP